MYTRKKTALAQGSYVKDEIIIEKSTKLKQKAKSQVEQTCCHEVIHSWLDHLSYDDLSKDEKFVDLMGQCLYQFLETKD